jgi:signal transduction histidine kinase
LVVPASDIIGLFGNIKILINDLSEIHPIKIYFKTENIEQGDLNDKMQLAIFRIVQEQINNILKHSKATHATIFLSLHHDEIILIISDDGEGWDETKGKPGVGLINIKSRAELYHGSSAVDSSPGKGFELKVVLHLDDRN